MATRTTIVTDTMTRQSDPNNFAAYQIHRGSHSPDARSCGLDARELFGYWWKSQHGALPAKIEVIEHYAPWRVGQPLSDGYTGPREAFLVDGVYYILSHAVFGRDGDHSYSFRSFKTCPVS